MNEEFNLVIALDIGSRYSGYACQNVDTFRSNPSNVWINSQWGQPMEVCKTSTAVLISSDWVAHSFGNKAELMFYREYDKNRENAKQDWFFFKDFKMALYTKNFRDSISEYIEDYFSRKKPIVEVMSKLIELLKNDCIQRYERIEKINLDRVRWIITVPAIWTEHAKNIMRRAAEMAGIPGKKLILALEPEAAAINCIFLSKQEKSGMCNLGISGDKFLVVDLGGGTLDVTGVEVLEDGKLKQILRSHGGPWGGHRVNDAFMNICKETFKSKDGTALFSNCRKADLLKLELEFEKRKIEASDKVGSSEGSNEIEIDLPHDIKENLLSRQGGTTNAGQFFIKPSGFFFRPSVIKDLLYRETINNIKAHLIELSPKMEAKGIQKVVLVGGLSESPLIVEEIRSLFSNIPVFICTNPFMAVLKGAVLFGQNTDIIQARISPCTYILRREGDARASQENELAASVRVNQIMPLDQRNHFRLESFREIHPRESSNEINVPLYQSEHDYPDFLGESCRQLGILHTKLPSGTPWISLDLVLVHGGTELKVKLVDRDKGKEYEATINFCS
ncbi:hypothetical protein CHS0354_025365 [Potamilus streckersoni]|uniref:Heat shock 70 kDa protein 12B n=1 Tax=Potamilus streckersoni TaxID=2493646 RepID=A0AAE0VZN8_9BIVA|nr:hypothetical protein CHS0354_025365 [Potamilus streckersoni]